MGHLHIAVLVDIGEDVLECGQDSICLDMPNIVEECHRVTSNPWGVSPHQIIWVLEQHPNVAEVYKRSTGWCIHITDGLTLADIFAIFVVYSYLCFRRINHVQTLQVFDKSPLIW